MPALLCCDRGIRSHASGLIGAPIRRHTIVVVNLDFAAAVAPVEVLPGGKRRRALQFLLREIEMVSAERAIVSQTCPGDRQMLLSHPEEAAEAEHRVSNVAAELIDHKALDGDDLATVGTAHRGAFNPVAGNQAMGLTGDVSVCMAASVAHSTSASAS